MPPDIDNLVETDDRLVDIGATVPRTQKDLLIRAAKSQGVSVTVIVRMALKNAEPFLLSLVLPETEGVAK